MALIDKVQERLAALNADGKATAAPVATSGPTTGGGIVGTTMAQTPRFTAPPAPPPVAAPPPSAAPTPPPVAAAPPIPTTIPAASAPPAPAQPALAPWTPATRTVDADTETVAGQVHGIIAAGSPLLTQAQAQAEQAANRRGLVNSSMAAQAGQAALYQAALPIAQADAQAYQQAAAANQAARNAAGQFNADWTNRTALTAFDDALQTARMQFSNDLQQQNMRLQDQMNALQAERNNAMQQGNMVLASQLDQQMARLNQEIAQQNAHYQNSLSQENQRLAAQLEAAAREHSSQLSLANENVLRTNAAAQQAMLNYSAQVAQILADPNIESGNKQGLIDKLYQQTQITLRAIGVVTNMDFGNLLNFGAAPAPAPAAAPAATPPPQPDYLTGGTVGGSN